MNEDWNLFFSLFSFFKGLHNRSRVSVHLASSASTRRNNRWFKLDQGGRGIIYNKDSPLLLRRIEAGLVASRGLLGSSVLGSLFTLKWKHLLCIQSNRARGMGGGDRLKVVQDRREAKKKREKKKRKENSRNQGRFKSFVFVHGCVSSLSRTKFEGRDPLTTALTPSEQSGLTQFLVQFARGTRVCLKPTEMKMDQKEKGGRKREGEKVED